MNRLGFKVKVGKILEVPTTYPSYLSGSPRERGEEINLMFADKQVQAILCVRGGYGSAQIIPYLDIPLISKNPKVFIGYSDITNLHSVFQMFCHFCTYHGPMLCTDMLEDFDPYTQYSLKQMVSMGGLDAFYNPEGGENLWSLGKGKAEGILAGGNLTVLQRAAGTFFQLDTKDKILFLEDINESIPKIDMYLNQMEYAGMFDHAAGILLGSFTNCQDNIELFLQERFQIYGIPVIGNLACGHKKPMATLPLGAYCRMDAEKKRITFHYY